MVKGTILHNYLYEKIRDKANRIDSCMEMRELTDILICFRISKNHTNQIIKEMVNIGLLERVNQRKIKVLKNNNKKRNSIERLIG